MLSGWPARLRPNRKYAIDQPVFEALAIRHSLLLPRTWSAVRRRSERQVRAVTTRWVDKIAARTAGLGDRRVTRLFSQPSAGRWSPIRLC
jgi:hypothetical protein